LNACCFAKQGDGVLNKYVLIALGGALGSITRYWVGSTLTGKLGARFPYGTFVINITACIVIGFAMGFLGKRTGLNPAWRFLIPVGFVGAYSTFSTFEWETYINLQNGAYWIALLYVVLSFVFGLAAVWGGAMVAKYL
jgi:CrcB protein